MNTRTSDPIRRAVRTFIQGALGVFVLFAVPALNDIVTSVGSGGVAVIDVPFWRNVGIAAVAGGVIALISFAQNYVEDHSSIPAILKSPPSSGQNPAPDGR